MQHQSIVSKSMHSLSQMASASLLANLRNDLEKESRNSTFACGGNIPIKTDSTTRQSGTAQAPVDLTSSNAPAIEPVTIRFGPPGLGQTLHFPVNASEQSAFDHLINDCQPATLGHDGQDVYDETYRKATKMDNSACTDFCPYEAGIIDVIVQLLLPEVSNKRGIRAELYKLNVYSGPSGKFKSHVDTPRGRDQIRSLVVCLPSAFKGMSTVPCNNVP